jgi:hypothetical protein
MGNVKTAISLEEKLFEQGEAAARDLKLSRSGLYALALEEFLKRRENNRLAERLDEAYADGGDQEDRDFLRAAAQRLFERGDEW